MKKILTAAVFAATLFLSSCSSDLFVAKTITLTFEFKNFGADADASAGSCYLAGGFTKNGWGDMKAYPVTFAGGNSNVVTVPDQGTIDKILFRLSTTGWSNPDGIDMSVLEPNAWNNLADDHSYDSGDPNWGIGPGNGETAGAGVASPSGGFAFGNTYAVVINGNGGTGRASLAIDGVTYW